MSKLNGKLMSRDTVVAMVENGIVSVVNENLVPLYFHKNNFIENWLKDRAIDEHRTNSRLLKKALRLQNKDDISTVLSVNAVTLTDTYWFCPENQKLSWEDVRFKENYFAYLALKGSFDAFNQEPSKTPELTNRGSFEKCWLQKENKWWLYKTGSDNELFSELFICKLGEKLGFEMAHYELSDGYIRSLDFTNSGEYNLEPMKALIGDNDDYNDNFELLSSISPSLAEDYLKMIYLDTVCLNVDRHTENYGVLRDPETGNIIKLAPNYDNNIALISRGYTEDVSRIKDVFIKNYFADFIKNNQAAAKMFLKIDIPPITENMIDDCLNEIPIKVDKEYIKNFVLNGQYQIEKQLGFVRFEKKLLSATELSALTDNSSTNVLEKNDPEYSE